MRIGLLLIVFCVLFACLAGCARTSTMRVYSESAKDTVELHLSDVPTDSVCAVENRSKYPEDWTYGCDFYQTSMKVMKPIVIVLLAIPCLLVVAGLPFIMAGGK